MRSHFIKRLVNLAHENNDIFLLCGDLGYAALEPFAEKFPNRFINVGIAEQNMMGVAAGLALSGKRVFVYSIINFAIIRCLEQIRNDICYHNANVTIVAVGAGFVYGTQGYTHFGVEDLALTRAFPNLSIYSPADAIEIEHCINFLFTKNGPAYLRLGRGGEPLVHKTQLRSEYEKAFIELSPCKEISVIATGPIIKEAELAANNLKNKGMEIGLYSAPFLTHNNFKNNVLSLASKSKIIITLEEHLITGGLGSAVAEIIAESQNSTKLIRLGVKPEGLKKIGNQQFLREINQINADSMEKLVTELRYC